MNSWHNVTEVYTQLVENGDHITTHWPLVHTPIPCVAIIAAYIAFVVLAPRYFRDKKPVSIRPVLIVYNIAMVALSFHMFKEFAVSAYLGNYKLKCQEINRSSDPLAIRMATAFWLFYISKTVELMDTVFLVLRKKDNQLTFLHVFHHSSMLFIQWTTIKFIPSGHAFFQGLMNSFVHVVMYTYYGLACFPQMRPYLWWKRYLTMFQLTQFVLIILHTCVGLYYACDFPFWPGYQAISYCLVLIVLFLNFYVQAYRRKGEAKRRGLSVQIQTNGEPIKTKSS